MTPQEPLGTSSGIAARSDQEFNLDGNGIITAELLGGAIAHYLVATADFQPNWQIRNHSCDAFAAELLSSAKPHTSWQADTAQGGRRYGAIRFCGVPSEN